MLGETSTPITCLQRFDSGIAIRPTPHPKSIPNEGLKSLSRCKDIISKVTLTHSSPESKNSVSI